MSDRHARGVRGERGLTMIELCIVIVILGILMVIGIASLLRARSSSNEAAAIGALRTINTAQFAYASACGAGNYATSLPILAVVPPGNTQGYLSEDLGAEAAPMRSGYQFTLDTGADGAAGPDDCNGTATQTAYYATATPTTVGQTGVRAFATNQSGGIWQSTGDAGVPPAEPFGPPAIPVR